jgi:hypothetical protein
MTEDDTYRVLTRDTAEYRFSDDDYEQDTIFGDFYTMVLDNDEEDRGRIQSSYKVEVIVRVHRYKRPEIE